jgi:hypothetical protein
VLIISEYNCAALALTGCLQINPFNLVETAEGALTPPSLPSLPSTHARAGTIARLQARLHMLLYYMVARLHDFLHACTIARLGACICWNSVRVAWAGIDTALRMAESERTLRSSRDMQCVAAHLATCCRQSSVHPSTQIILPTTTYGDLPTRST